MLPARLPKFVRSSTPSRRAKSEMSSNSRIIKIKGTPQVSQMKWLQASLEADYLSLSQDVASLESELLPLRDRATELQYFIMNNYGQFVIEEKKPSDFSSIIIEMQNEKIELQRQYQTMKSVFSTNAIKDMKDEIEELKREVNGLARGVHSIESQADEFQTQIERYRYSRVFSDIQTQKARIRDLTQSLNAEMERYKTLKAEHYVLSDPSASKEQKSIEADYVIKLNRKLNALRRKHFEQCDMLIQLREKQVSEINQVTNAIRMRQQSLAQLETIPNLDLHINLQPNMAAIRSEDNSSFVTSFRDVMVPMDKVDQTEIEAFDNISDPPEED